MSTSTPVVRAYRVRSSANPAKLVAVAAIVPVWQAGLARAQAEIRRTLLTAGALPRWVDAKDWGGGLSQRQWDSVNQQAVASHRSWLGNCERVFRDLVVGSTLPELTKFDLLYVNAAHAWYRPLTADAPVQLSAKRMIEPQVFVLARTIMRQVRKRVGAPDLRRVQTMVMDGKIASVTTADAGEHADFWVRISTLTSGKPVWIPLHSNRNITQRLSRPGAVLANHCQVAIRPGGQVQFRLLVKTPRAEQSAERSRAVGLDWGMATLFATSDGTLHGRGFLERLRRYDQRLQPLIAALHRNRVKLCDSRRYRELVRDIRGFVTNEVNRCLNRILDPNKGGAGDVARVVVEKLDFRGLAKTGRLSKRLRRLLTVAGRATVTRKLEALRDDLGFEIEQQPAAYSSQECTGCGYTHPSNRRDQARFRCRFCGKTVHADIDGARTLLRRSQTGGLTPYRTRGQVLDHLDECFQSHWGLSFAAVAERQTKPVPRVAPSSATTAAECYGLPSVA
ncbi:zinc ribbon domain-containing protein [Mycobacteroides abscessus]|uniref:zinc ribbon domain-containing protein n=1 Tax=Mycobacteroides abscessus TaxID=36809 RepID=UPI00192845D9|nr:zinc ribbon domain-containing protein [Mycobacteroides abscessus]MBL3752915.1 transposase [Mycobacteroides abscessus subsp. massiliense]